MKNLPDFIKTNNYAMLYLYDKIKESQKEPHMVEDILKEAIISLIEERPNYAAEMIQSMVHSYLKCWDEKAVINFINQRADDYKKEYQL